MFTGKHAEKEHRLTQPSSVDASVAPAALAAVESFLDDIMHDSSEASGCGLGVLPDKCVEVMFSMIFLYIHVFGCFFMIL